MPTHHVTAIILDENSLLTLGELQQASAASDDFILELIEHELIIPQGSSQQEWRFDSACLKRTAQAWRFYRDLEVNVAGIALVLDLLAELEHLKRELKLHQHPDERDA